MNVIWEVVESVLDFFGRWTFRLIVTGMLTAVLVLIGNLTLPVPIESIPEVTFLGILVLMLVALFDRQSKRRGQ